MNSTDSMSDNSVIGITLVLLLVLLSGSFALGTIYRKTEHIFYKEHQQLIQECQSKLPRDKFCKLIAVEDK